MDVRNFNVFDETAEKKKFIFRLQSKTTLLASLGNELCLDDPIEKKVNNLTIPVTGSTQTTESSNPPSLTDILFKTKNLNDMKRLFGLLQWKNSLIYEENVSERNLFKFLGERRLIYFIYDVIYIGSTW